MGLSLYSSVALKAVERCFAAAICGQTPEMWLMSALAPDSTAERKSLLTWLCVRAHSSNHAPSGRVQVTKIAVSLFGISGQVGD